MARYSVSFEHTMMNEFLTLISAAGRKVVVEDIILCLRVPDELAIPTTPSSAINMFVSPSTGGTDPLLTLTPEPLDQDSDAASTQAKTDWNVASPSNTGGDFLVLPMSRMGIKTWGDTVEWHSREDGSEQIVARNGENISFWFAVFSTITLCSLTVVFNELPSD